jgi:hypothetical protein
MDCSSSLGYLQDLKIHRIVSDETKNLSNDFIWSSVPMLSVITGVNGIGKTAVLHAILNAYLCSKNIAMSSDVTLKFRDANANQRIFLHSTLELEPYFKNRVARFDNYGVESNGAWDVIASYMGSVIYITSYPKCLVYTESVSHKISSLIVDPDPRPDNRLWNVLATLTDVKHFAIHLIRKLKVTEESLNKFLKENKFKYQIHTLARKYTIRIFHPPV